MLDVAVEADDRRLAVGNGRARQRAERLAHQQLAELLAPRDQLGEVVGGLPGQRVGDHGAGGRAGDGPQGRQPAFVVDGIADENEAADIHSVISRSGE